MKRKVFTSRDLHGMSKVSQVLCLVHSSPILSWAGDPVAGGVVGVPGYLVQDQRNSGILEMWSGSYDLRILGPLLADGSRIHSFLLVKEYPSTRWEWGGKKRKRRKGFKKHVLYCPGMEQRRLTGGSDMPVTPWRGWELILAAVCAVSIRIKWNWSLRLEKASVLTFYLFSWPWQ